MLSSIRTWSTEYRHYRHERVQRGKEGPNPHPLENLKAIGFLWYTVLEPLGNHKATKPAILGPTAKGSRMLSHFQLYTGFSYAGRGSGWGIMNSDNELKKKTMNSE